MSSFHSSYRLSQSIDHTSKDPSIETFFYDVATPRVFLGNRGTGIDAPNDDEMGHSHVSSEEHIAPPNELCISENRATAPESESTSEYKKQETLKDEPQHNGGHDNTNAESVENKDSFSSNSQLSNAQPSQAQRKHFFKSCYSEPDAAGKVHCCCVASKGQTGCCRPDVRRRFSMEDASRAVTDEHEPANESITPVRVVVGNAIHELCAAFMRKVPVNLLVEFRRVRRVFDGDTIQMSGGGRPRVRLLGVVSPQVKNNEKFVSRACEVCRTLCPAGCRVMLQFCERERVDKFGCLLAIIYVHNPFGAGYICLNTALLEMGLAHLYKSSRTRPESRNAMNHGQKIARSMNKNIWKKIDEAQTVLITPNDESFHKYGSDCIAGCIEVVQMKVALDLMCAPCPVCLPLR